MPKLTLEEIKNSTKEMLTPLEVSGILKCAPYQINVQAFSDAEKGTNYLKFPVVILGRYVKIPRRRFIEFIEGEGSDRNEKHIRKRNA